ncbi:NAD(P)/FAD-dependent oxidoreductase [Dyadobacter sp. CY323]|uniref:NAD(P)/FAD-dependent oxidoreductase n=1 Tax=Dyadobacter sp. CY323 TaxID=2907302 RepID=UPI001F1FB94E|nr:NAD(P)/FAD-dependent oxidoreductase [Dyadobacter sp. CY323]MCE6987570.1 NAD(P)/FAD-dependent oxidoreductase [Dyadobacter sp. CY323]
METQEKVYECAIIGGGLAGLCLSIQLADKGYSVLLFEKNKFPFHKVCGEYISMESRDFLIGLGLPYRELNLPVINTLGISSEQGFMLEHQLEMGGFGISRFTLDNQLFEIAESKGVKVMQGSRVTDVAETGSDYQIQTSDSVFRARIVCGSYGKYTPQFIHLKQVVNPEIEANNYIGVKYHIKASLPPNRIELHNFKDGYCGVSKVDRDWYCLCYLTTANNLLQNGKDIKLMEQNVLYKNPYLKAYFTESEFVNEQPLVISNVHFNKKQTDTDGIFLLGDAAGSITPLCGNGMSMAMRASKLLATELILFVENKQTKEQALKNYQNAWNHAFKTRITAGYHLQNLFGKRTTTDLALRALSKMPRLTGKLVSLTHGDVF